MIDEQSKGEVIFKYRIDEIRSFKGGTYNEMLVIKKYDGEKISYYAIVRNPLVDENDDVEPERERPLIETDDECFKDCVVIKELTKEQVDDIINIIESNKALPTVASFVPMKSFYGDGLEQFYFACPSFSVATQGYGLSNGVFFYFRDQEPPFESLKKEAIDSIIASKAHYEIEEYLAVLGVTVFEEDEEDEEDKAIHEEIRKEQAKRLLGVNEKIVKFYHLDE